MSVSTPPMSATMWLTSPLGLDDLNDARDRMPTGRVREFDVLRTDPENYLFCPATSAACPSERG